jgi:hypothetical protein
VIVEFARGGELEQGFEELGRPQRRAELLDRDRVLVAVNEVMGDAGGIVILSPAPRRRSLPSITNSRLSPVKRVRLSWRGWMCFGSGTALGG